MRALKVLAPLLLTLVLGACAGGAKMQDMGCMRGFCGIAAQTRDSGSGPVQVTGIIFRESDQKVVAVNGSASTSFVQGFWSGTGPALALSAGEAVAAAQSDAGDTHIDNGNTTDVDNNTNVRQRQGQGQHQRQRADADANARGGGARIDNRPVMVVRINRHPHRDPDDNGY